MEYSRKKAILIIVISTLLVSGVCTASLLFFHLQEKLGLTSSHYVVRKIVQTSPRYEAIKTQFLAEILQLSSDHPTNIEDFDVKKGVEKLLNTHVIAKATIKKLKPETLFIDYEVREPIAEILDLSNTFVDETGMLFPAYPFYTPKKLCKLILGDKNLVWGEKINENKRKLCLGVIEQLKGAHLGRIDLSSAWHPTLGKREIVVMVRKKEGVHTLRLPTLGYEQAIAHYLHLPSENTSMIIDLRLEGVAYINRNCIFSFHSDNVGKETNVRENGNSSRRKG